MKKGLIFLVLAVLIAGVVFAQEDRAANVRNNWISGELSLVGVGLRYERMLGPNWSWGVNAYFSTIILYSDIGIDASVRFYPWGKNFFAGAGLGFHDQFLMQMFAVVGVAITPEVGWKIDVGKEGEFYLQPGVKVPITFGTFDGEFFTRPGFVGYLGMGYAF
ncbi:MAG: hypothetical protein LBH43_16560 [Treponema sp.]|jgi:hypothetical protein|nr:hypothetical protein [Treponema sp.]